MGGREFEVVVRPVDVGRPQDDSRHRARELLAVHAAEDFGEALGPAGEVVLLEGSPSKNCSSFIGWSLVGYATVLLSHWNLLIPAS